MKTLHRYLLRQVLATLVMTVLVFAFVLMLGNILKEILSLLVNRQTSFLTVVEAVSYLVPYVFMYALPMGMLTATLLTFGRFSAELELTAVRAGGVSLLALSMPVLVFSLFLTGFSAVISTTVAPRCHAAYRDLLFRVGMESAMAMIPEGRYVRDFSDHLFYVGKVKGDTLRDIHVYELDKDGVAQRYCYAESGRLVLSTNREATLFLNNPRVTLLSDGVWQPGNSGSEAPIRLTRDAEMQKEHKTRISDMSLSELLDELHDLERRMQAPLPLVSRDDLPKKRRDWEKQRNTLISPILTAIHSNLSLAFSCFSFTLVGIPLAIRAHRRETSIGVAYALGLVVVFQGLIMLGEALATRPEFHPYLIVWLPNFLFQGVGCVLLWRANRGI